MRISNINIKHYRSIADSGDINPTKLFALIGRNNTGKSTVLKALQILWLQQDLHEEDFHKNKKKKIEISACLEEFSENSRYTEYQDELGKIRIGVIYDKDLSPTYYLNGDSITPTKFKKILPPLLSIPDIRNPQGEATGGTNSFMKDLIGLILKAKNEETQVLGGDNLEEKKLGDATDDEIKRFLESRRRKDLVDLAKEVSSYFQRIVNTDNFHLEIIPAVDLSKISYETRIVDRNLQKDLERGVSILSCGTGLQSMYILALLETYANTKQHFDDSILLIEEPEVYLHPDFQRKMFQALRQIASTNQVIYTTHSPIMISDLWLVSSIRLVRLEEGETVIEKINIDLVINELGIRYDDILNVKNIIFVEGPTDAVFFRHILCVLYPDSSPELLDKYVKFIPTDSIRKVQTFALMKILHSDTIQAPFFAIVDSDGRKAERRKSEKISSIVTETNSAIKAEELEQRIFVLNRHALESYFLDFDLLAKAFPDTERNALKFMLEFYNKKYEENRERLEKGEDKRLQARLSPKHFFTQKELRHEKVLEEYEKLFENNESFLFTRAVIAKKCDEEKYVEFILKAAGTDYSLFDEPKNILLEISKSFFERIPSDLNDKNL
ncbi:MAG TPA: AAA family ATPase [Thermodesulfobacteriota bacterium]